MELVRDFFIEVLASWLASKMDKLAKDMPLLRTSLLTHRREMRAKLNAMPFIYKDLSGELLSDFVDVDIETLDANTLSRRAPQKIDITSEERLKQRRKAVFLGNAGIGKTTFLRYTILSLLSGRDLDFFYPEEDLVPIYVPLKAVDNTAPSPILRYILRNTTFLRTTGLPRLLRLIENRRLILFLDGYDEIPFATTAEGANNYVRQELALILGATGGGSADYKHIKPEHKAFYAAIHHCRTWLSSRQEFFEQHTILPKSRNAQILIQDLVAIRIEGVGNNRAILAKTIFDKYRDKSSVFRDLLSEEYFIQEIDSLEDLELKSLSFNPLFLTVMCYTYVQRALAAKTYRVPISESRIGLILECINLLLFDLDASKASDISVAERAGLLRRRNEFREEKVQFLHFLAAQLFLEQKTYFDYEYLAENSLRFFSVRDDAVSVQIVRGLKGKAGGMPNFAEQLVYSGVFVAVDRSLAEGIFYDFPHRQFREVLASVYFDKGETVDSLLDNINLKSLSELIILFFSRSHFQDRVLEVLLRATRVYRNDPYFGLLTVKCLEKKPALYHPSPVMRRFFEQSIVENEHFRAPIGLIDFFDADEELVRFIASEFKQSKVDVRRDSLAICCALLLEYNKPLLEELLSESFNLPKDYNNLAPQLLYYALSTNEQIIVRNFQWLRSDPEWFHLFCYSCATVCYHLVEQYHSIRAIIEELDLADFTRFLYILWKYRWQEQYTEPPMTLHPKSDIAFSIVRNYPPRSHNRPDTKRDHEFCYIVTEDVIRVASHDVRRKLRLLKLNVYWSREALEKRLDALNREESLKISFKELTSIVQQAQVEAANYIAVVNQLLGFDFSPPAITRVFDKPSDFVTLY